MSSERRAAVEAFLYREARLMDESRYEQWLELFTADALYWIPSNHDDIDPQKHVSIVYAQRPQLEAQIARLTSGNAHTQVPPSRMRRIVSNVEIEEAANDETHARAVFDLTEVRVGKQRTIAGRSVYHLRREGEDFRIAYKKVELVANDDVLDNLTFLI